MGVMLMGLAVAATSGMFLASKRTMRLQGREIETTQAARSAIDMIVRDLRLGGACLPVTGDFISLDGLNNGNEDEITTRTGLTRPDLSCIRSTIPTNPATLAAPIAANATAIPVENSEGFASGMRAYIRHPDGEGEYFTVSAVPSTTQINKSAAWTRDYPATSGIYAIDERRFFIQWWTSPRGLQPELRIQVGSTPATSFAVGIEKLNIQYELRENCPACTVMNIPITNAQWSVVEKVKLSITARSELPDEDGTYYRRTVTVDVKPRNLLPQ